MASIYLTLIFSASRRNSSMYDWSEATRHPFCFTSLSSLSSFLDNGEHGDNFVVIFHNDYNFKNLTICKCNHFKPEAVCFASGCKKK